MIEELVMLMRAWRREAQRHAEADMELTQSKSDAVEAALHVEAARVYRICASALAEAIQKEVAR